MVPVEEEDFCGPRAVFEYSSGISGFYQCLRHQSIRMEWNGIFYLRIPRCQGGEVVVTCRKCYAVRRCAHRA